jgi:hypothetical protein
LKPEVQPAGPDEPRFFGAILDEISFPHALSDRVCKRQAAAVRMLRETNVRLLIIDEVHNLLSGSRLQQRRLLNLLRWLGNELQIPLVAVGTADALHAIPEPTVSLCADPVSRPTPSYTFDRSGSLAGLRFVLATTQFFSSAAGFAARGYGSLHSGGRRASRPLSAPAAGRACSRRAS